MFKWLNSRPYQYLNIRLSVLAYSIFFIFLANLEYVYVLHYLDLKEIKSNGFKRKITYILTDITYYYTKHIIHYLFISFERKIRYFLKKSVCKLIANKSIKFFFNIPRLCYIYMTK